MITISTYHQVDINDRKNLKKLKETCDAFESEILKFYLKQALKTDNPLFPKSPGEHIYKAMYQEALADKISGNFGYSELLFNYLKDKV